MMAKFYFIILILFIIPFVYLNPIFPLKKLVVIDNLNDLTKETKKIYNDIIGIGIEFRTDSDLNILPINLLEFIFYFYDTEYQDEYSFGMRYNVYYNAMVCYEDEVPEDVENIFFVLENKGIMLPFKDIFNKDDKGINIFKFIGVKDSDRIIIGKSLMELMDIKFIGNNDFIINNKTYEAKIDDKFFL